MHKSYVKSRRFRCPDFQNVTAPSRHEFPLEDVESNQSVADIKSIYSDRLSARQFLFSTSLNRTRPRPPHPIYYRDIPTHPYRAIIHTDVPSAYRTSVQARMRGEIPEIANDEPTIEEWNMQKPLLESPARSSSKTAHCWYSCMPP
jgi:hypothetical protein